MIKVITLEPLNGTSHIVPFLFLSYLLHCFSHYPISYNLIFHPYILTFSSTFPKLLSSISSTGNLYPVRWKLNIHRRIKKYTLECTRTRIEENSHLHSAFDVSLSAGSHCTLYYSSWITPKGQWSGIIILIRLKSMMLLVWKQKHPHWHLTTKKPLWIIRRFHSQARHARMDHYKPHSSYSRRKRAMPT